VYYLHSNLDEYDLIYCSLGLYVAILTLEVRVFVQNTFQRYLSLNVIIIICQMSETKLDPFHKAGKLSRKAEGVTKLPKVA
jgi:hypothetical protein